MTTRSFQPGPGFFIAMALGALAAVLALSAAMAGALGVRGASSVLGGAALVVVGAGMLALLRVPARSLVVNAPRLRLERTRARLAQRRGPAGGAPDPGPAGRRQQSAVRPAGAQAQPTGDVGAVYDVGAAGATGATRTAGATGAIYDVGAVGAAGATETAGAVRSGAELLRTPGTGVFVPGSTGGRELTTLDIVSGPVTATLASTSAGRLADEHLAGTTIGETLVRVLQLLCAAFGFVLFALGLATILMQVLS